MKKLDKFGNSKKLNKLIYNMEEYNYCKYCKKYISKIYRDKNKNKDKYINNIELLNQKLPIWRIRSK